MDKELIDQKTNSTNNISRFNSVRPSKAAPHSVDFPIVGSTPRTYRKATSPAEKTTSNVASKSSSQVASKASVISKAPITTRFSATLRNSSVPTSRNSMPIEGSATADSSISPENSTSTKAPATSEKSSTSKNKKFKSSKKLPILVASVLALAGIGIGVFFLISKNSPAPDTNSSDLTKQADNSSDLTEQAGDPDYHPQLGGDFSAFEQRGNEYYLEVNVNGEYSGSCEFSIIGPDDETPTKKEAPLSPAEGGTSICSVSLSYTTVTGNNYLIGAILKSGDETVDLSRTVEY